MPRPSPSLCPVHSATDRISSPGPALLIWFHQAQAQVYWCESKPDRTPSPCQAHPKPSQSPAKAKLSRLSPKPAQTKAQAQVRPKQKPSQSQGRQAQPQSFSQAKPRPRIPAPEIQHIDDFEQIQRIGFGGGDVLAFKTKLLINPQRISDDIEEFDD